MTRRAYTNSLEHPELGHLSWLAGWSDTMVAALPSGATLTMIEDEPVFKLLRDAGDDLICMAGADTCLAALRSYSAEVVPKDAAHSIDHNSSIFATSVRQLIQCMRALVVGAWQSCATAAENKAEIDPKEIPDIQRGILDTASSAHGLLVKALSSMETVRPAAYTFVISSSLVQR